MHADAFPIDDTLARHLVDAQFPDFRGLALRRVASDGTDNVLYRLGEDVCLRLPSRPAASASIETELTWLPRLGTLPLHIPQAIARGAPNAAYPSPWGVFRWLDGERVDSKNFTDASTAARTLAKFVRALHALDASAGPPAGAGNNYRGAPLAFRNAPVRAAIEAVADLFDTALLSAEWETCLDAPVWTGDPVWIHGDIHAGNLLMRGGTLSAVIDFGLMGVGDPAVDLLPAWSLFAGATRDAFRDAASADSATWVRGRGWALSTALVALAYYRKSNKALAEQSSRVIEAVMADVGD